LRYAATDMTQGPVQQFKMMVRTLHAASIEVLLDVVYNHTAEGSHLGPTLSLRGIDNASFDRQVDADPRYSIDYKGCGNSMRMRHSKALQLIMDSFRYWVRKMHVDEAPFAHPATLDGLPWHVLFDTARTVVESLAPVENGSYTLSGRSFVALRVASPES